MTPADRAEGRPRRMRAGRGGRGAGRGAGRRGCASTSLTRGAAASAAAFVAKDVLEPDGVVRPLLRGLAERLQATRSALFSRAGARYLELDPYPVDVIEPARPLESIGPPHDAETIETAQAEGDGTGRRDDAGPARSTLP